MKGILIFIVCLCLIAIGAPLYLSSAAMIGLSTEKLTKASEIVIMGEVDDVEAHWSNDGKTIVTRASVVISDLIKGKTRERTIIVEQEGGEVGDIGLKVSDVSSLKKGERLILFLKPGKSKKKGFIYTIVGKAQGKYMIDENDIAKKSGFSILSGEEEIDNNIPVEALIKKIRRIK